MKQFVITFSSSFSFYWTRHSIKVAEQNTWSTLWSHTLQMLLTISSCLCLKILDMCYYLVFYARSSSIRECISVNYNRPRTGPAMVRKNIFLFIKILISNGRGFGVLG